MITIKREHYIISEDLNKLIREYNNVLRFSYNRRKKDNITKCSMLEKVVKTTMKNIHLDASWIKCAVKKSTELSLEKKLYFGGKANHFKRKYKKIDVLNKNTGIEMRGSCSDKGNRKAIIKDNILTFKPYKGLTFDIPLSLSRNEKVMLGIIGQQCLLKQNYFNIELNEKYIWISFNEPVIEKHEFKKDRILGIDLNPNYIALAILDNTKEIYKELIDLTELNKCSKNKKQNELSLINKYIVKICKAYHVEYVSTEDLNMWSSNKNKGKSYNKLLNNDWNRNFIINNLTKWLNISDIKCLKVNPFYTSFMGCIKNTEDYDSIAASKEVCYRAYLLIKNINIKDYVCNFLSDQVDTQRKEILPDVYTYKDLYNHIKFKKKPLYSARFLFNKTEKLKRSSLRFKFYMSKVDIIRL